MHAMNGWIYFNTNCANKEDNQEECGGLVRSDKSVWLCGFLINLGRCNADVVELFGVLEELCLMQACGYSKFKLHVDSKDIIDTFEKWIMNTQVGD